MQSVDALRWNSQSFPLGVCFRLRGAVLQSLDGRVWPVEVQAQAGGSEGGFQTLGGVPKAFFAVRWFQKGQSDPVQFGMGFEKDRFVFVRGVVSLESPTPERRQVACKAHILASEKAHMLEPLLDWTESIFPLLQKKKGCGKVV